MDGHLGGEGVVLVGPLGDQGPEGRIGGEDTMVAVAVDPGWREDLGQAVEELEGREAEGGTAGGVGFGEHVEDLVGVAADEVEPVESEGGPCAVPDQPFEPGAVGPSGS